MFGNKHYILQCGALHALASYLHLQSGNGVDFKAQLGAVMLLLYML